MTTCQIHPFAMSLMSWSPEERSGQDFSIDIPVDNSQGAVTAAVQVDALKHDGTLDVDLHRRLSGDYTISAAMPEVPTYDADGNMLTCDGWTFTWNAQDRLVSATKGDTRLEFNYDYLGRRFEKKVYESNVLVKHQLFVYDGFKQIAEYDALDSNTLANTYVWQPAGLDVPLLRNGSEFLVSDANKNIVALLDTTGQVTDSYLYDPFGNSAHTGTSTNPFRFSSEFFDEETGLVYYNYRYYSPELGRWLSRDPIEEIESENLYLFVENSPDNLSDWLGWYTLGDAEDSLRKKGTPPAYPGYWNPYTGQWVIGVYSGQQLFNEWVVLEKADSSWLATIPNCPDKICVVNGQPKDCNNGKWESIDEASKKYHPGASWCMRSKTSSGSAQQCCYNEEGDLVKSGISAGTPDRHAAVFLNGLYLKHYFHDVAPFEIAYRLDGESEGANILAYLSVRPPNQGGGSCYK